MLEFGADSSSKDCNGAFPEGVIGAASPDAVDPACARELSEVVVGHRLRITGGGESRLIGLIGTGLFARAALFFHPRTDLPLVMHGTRLGLGATLHRAEHVRSIATRLYQGRLSHVSSIATPVSVRLQPSHVSVFMVADNRSS